MVSHLSMRLGCLWYFFLKIYRSFSICGFQGTYAKSMLKTVWKARFPKQVSIFDFIACLHATERTLFSRCIRSSTLTDVYQSLENSMDSNPLITGKNQLYGTALPCWIRLTHLSRLPASQASLSAPPIQICPFYIKHSREWFSFFRNPAATCFPMPSPA